MNTIVQEIIGKGFGIEISDDCLRGKMTIDGNRGEMIVVTCPFSELIDMAANMLDIILATLVRKGAIAEDSGTLFGGRASNFEDHVAGRVKVVTEQSGYALVVNTVADKQLRILLMHAQRDVVVRGLA